MKIINKNRKKVINKMKILIIKVKMSFRKKN